jgi:hypothetical protein
MMKTAMCISYLLPSRSCAETGTLCFPPGIISFKPLGGKPKPVTRKFPGFPPPSIPTLVISGVPQGSMLGPILCLIYANDLSSVCCDNTVLQLFAEDAKLYSNIGINDSAPVSSHRSQSHK